MKIGSFKENINQEKRIAITPEIAKKFSDNNFQINLQQNYASHLGFEDKDYEIANVKFFDNETSVIENSEILTQVTLPPKSLFEKFSQNQTLIGVLESFKNKEILNELLKKKLIVFH